MACCCTPFGLLIRRRSRRPVPQHVEAQQCLAVACILELDMVTVRVAIIHVWPLHHSYAHAMPSCCTMQSLTRCVNICCKAKVLPSASVVSRHPSSYQCQGRQGCVWSRHARSLPQSGNPMQKNFVSGLSSHARPNRASAVFGAHIAWHSARQRGGGGSHEKLKVLRAACGNRFVCNRDSCASAHIRCPKLKTLHTHRQTIVLLTRRQKEPLHELCIMSASISCRQARLAEMQPALHCRYPIVLANQGPAHLPPSWVGPSRKSSRTCLRLRAQRNGSGPLCGAQPRQPRAGYAQQVCTTHSRARIHLPAVPSGGGGGEK